MQITKLSAKGQVVVPKNIRARYHWNAGQKLIVIDMGDGIILKTATVQNHHHRPGGRKIKTLRPIRFLEEMEAAIKKKAPWSKRVMISVDTNVVVRLLTGDDPDQFQKSRTLFEKEEIILTTSVILESEWVLAIAYQFKPLEIADAFASLCGLPNVTVERNRTLFSPPLNGTNRVWILLTPFTFPGHWIMMPW
ncbi:MAG: hypothetical protein R2861_06650 [Desulfobacterales bacterium]